MGLKYKVFNNQRFQGKAAFPKGNVEHCCFFFANLSYFLSLQMVIYLTTQILFFNVAYAMNAISETRVWRIGIALIFILSFNIT